MNLAAIIEPHPDDAVALVSRDKVTTYGELRRQVAALRGGLAGLDVGPGDRVALVCANNWFFVVGYLAALGAGAAVVPLDPGSPPPELASVLAATRPRVAIVGPSARTPFSQLALHGLHIEHVLLPGGVELEGAEPLEPLLLSAPVPIVDRAPSDAAALMLTAGTSGPPRAAVLSHGNLLANLEQVQAHPSLALTSEDVSLGVLPLFHIFGLNVVLGVSLFAGAAVVLLERFDPVDALELIRFHQVTVVPGAPPMFTAWAAVPDADADDAFASVRLAVSGAAKLPEAVGRAFEERFGLPVSEGYGLTEASPIVTSSSDESVRYGSIGHPLPGIEVRLVDEDGDDALAGDPGEIWVRGPNVFGGYLDDEEATAGVLTPDGWLRTGDVAVADDDGYLWIVDRAKDLVIVSGFNVYPAEVEAVLRDHPGISDAVVVGDEHPYSGETVKAFVVAVPGTMLEEDEVIEHCAARLARYKCPTRVTVVDEIPRGLTGKALRRSLRGPAPTV